MNDGTGTGVPNPGIVRQDLAAWALFLDVDGTLLHIAPRPDAVKVEGDLVAVLGRLQTAFGGALALISGRQIAELDRLFAPLRLPVAGLHGLERRDASGQFHRLGSGESLNALRVALSNFAAGNPGVLLEDKGLSLALHYRQAPQTEALARDFVRDLVARQEVELRLLEGKMVLEIKPPLADKGSTVEAFLAEPPFAGRRPLFIGDDVTDEDAFRLVNRRKGISVRVGPAAATEARYTLPGVTDVLAWLRGLVAEAADASAVSRT